MAGWFASGLRWHPRFAFVLQALPLCGAAPALSATAGWFASGLRWHPRYGVCRSSVAPVRGGTYFSLPPQRKVGKRKRLTPPTFLLA